MKANELSVTIRIGNLELPGTMQVTYEEKPEMSTEHFNRVVQQLRESQALSLAGMFTSYGHNLIVKYCAETEEFNVRTQAIAKLFDEMEAKYRYRKQCRKLAKMLRRKKSRHYHAEYRGHKINQRRRHVQLRDD